MFQVWLNGESQGGGCDRWLQHCCIQTCVEAQKKGRLPNWAGKEGGGGGGGGLQAPSEALWSRSD